MLIEPTPIRRAADNPRTPYPRQHGFQAHVASRAAMADPNLPSKGDDNHPTDGQRKDPLHIPPARHRGRRCTPRGPGTQVAVREALQGQTPKRRPQPGESRQWQKTKQRRCSSGGARLHHPPVINKQQRTIMQMQLKQELTNMQHPWPFRPELEGAQRGLPSIRDEFLQG